MNNKRWFRHELNHRCVSDLIAHAYALAKLEASKQTGLDDGIFSDDCPWSFEQITDSSFFPD